MFASRADLSVPALQKILHVLGAALVIQGEDAVKGKAAVPEHASMIRLERPRGGTSDLAQGRPSLIVNCRLLINSAGG